MTSEWREPPGRTAGRSPRRRRRRMAGALCGSLVRSPGPDPDEPPCGSRSATLAASSPKTAACTASARVGAAETHGSQQHTAGLVRQRLLARRRPTPPSRSCPSSPEHNCAIGSSRSKSARPAPVMARSDPAPCDHAPDPGGTIASGLSACGVRPTPSGKLWRGWCHRPRAA